MSIKNKIYLWKPLKRLRQKKCENCIYAYKKGNIFACDKSGIWIEPLHLICFKKKRGENE